MTDFAQRDTPFPLKRYYLLYGGLGVLLFYVLLFTLFIHAERQALYDEYIHSVSEKARSMYMDIERDFLKPHGISIEQLDLSDTTIREGLRHEIEGIVEMDFSVTQVKLFRADAMTLYDHSDPQNEGHLYASRDEPGFSMAVQGKVKADIEVDSSGQRLMEAYLPIMRRDTEEVVAVIETSLVSSNRSARH